MSAEERRNLHSVHEKNGQQFIYTECCFVVDKAAEGTGQSTVVIYYNSTSNTASPPDAANTSSSGEYTRLKSEHDSLSILRERLHLHTFPLWSFVISVSETVRRSVVRFRIDL